MRVEEIDKLSKKDLRRMADECFAEAEQVGPLHAPAHFLRAQFFLSELNHRWDSWVSVRDLILEIIVIALIGWEIHMGYRQAADQQTQFNSQQAIFQNLVKSSEATAATLAALKGTTEMMNGTLQKQLALAYDVSINITYNQERKRLVFSNMGHTNVTLWGIRVFSDPASIDSQGRSIQANGGAYDIDVAAIYAAAAARLPKGQTGLAPFEVYFKNERGTEFVEHCYFGISWDGDVLKLAPQTASIVPENWSRFKAATKTPSTNQ